MKKSKKYKKKRLEDMVFDKELRNQIRICRELFGDQFIKDIERKIEKDRKCGE